MEQTMSEKNQTPKKSNEPFVVPTMQVQVKNTRTEPFVAPTMQIRVKEDASKKGK